jgi:hypothetical protein
LQLMQQVNEEAVTAQEGETAFILQLRPAVPPTADPAELSAQIHQFVTLYLGASGLDQARFASLETLTWAISAPVGEAAEIENIRADLAETLFGSADDDHVVVVRQGGEVEAPEAQAPEETASAEDPLAGWEPANSSAATRAAMEGASDELDLDVSDLEIVDNDVFEVDSWLVEPPSSADFDEDERIDLDLPATSDPAEPNFEALTEAPERSSTGGSDFAAELSAFRAEMRQIAAGIPSSGDSAALDQFRAELDTITGAMGQRVDGAAQRIESAADRVVETVSALPDAERMAQAVERAEASAQLMDSSVRDAVEALTAALKAMNSAAAGDETRAEFGV